MWFLEHIFYKNTLSVLLNVLTGILLPPSLGRMGNSRSALKMIMKELHDVDKAIEFAKEQDDGELWEDLILYSIDKPRKQQSHTCHSFFLSV